MANIPDDIERYRRGELTPAEMHSLEKEALNDPFLSDALEGADLIDATDFSSDIDELRGKITVKKRTSWVMPLRIAAGVALLVGFTFMIFKFMPKEGTLALKNEPHKESPKPSAPISADTIHIIGTEKSSDNFFKEDNKRDKDGESKKGMPRSSIASANTIAKKKKEESKDLQGVTPLAEQPVQVAEEDPQEEVRADALLDMKEKEKIASLDIMPTVPAGEAMSRKQSVTKSAAGKPSAAQNVLVGTVTDSDGSPIPGVNIVIKETDQGTVTDMQGHYELKAATPNSDLQFSFIGYQTKDLKADKSENNVQLNPDVSQLSEVVVTGIGTKDDDDREPVLKLAEPFGGKKAYDKYLDDNLRYPAEALTYKIKGKVTVEFTVRTDGSLDEFNVVKSLGHGCDDEVIRLVKEGPGWYPTTRDNVPIESSVRVKMKFDPAKAK